MRVFQQPGAIRLLFGLEQINPFFDTRIGHIPDRAEVVEGTKHIVVPAGGEGELQPCRFDDFAGALAFTNRVGEIAEREGHHPALLTEWGRTTVTWWTHKIGGLHRNDFIMAAKTDELHAEATGSRRAGPG